MRKDEYDEALVAIRRKIYDDEGVDMREQMMDKIRQWFVAYREVILSLLAALLVQQNK